VEVELARAFSLWDRVAHLCSYLAGLGTGEVEINGKLDVMGVLFGMGVPAVRSLVAHHKNGFSGIKAHTQNVNMNTVALDRFAEENPGVAFIHTRPGLVSKGNTRRRNKEGSVATWLIWWILEPLLNLLGRVRAEVSV
jgi:hypothetical protein